MSASNDHGYEPSESEPVFQHQRREQWGLAILVWQGEDRRRYQFEDGQLRTFKEGYYHLLPEVSIPPEEAESVVERLVAKFGRSRKRKRSAGTSAPRRRPDLLGVADLVAIFKETYPALLEDARWVSDVRGQGAKKRRKGHREPAIAEAQRLLSAERLEELRATGDASAVHAAAIQVLQGTSLVTPKQIAPIERLSPTDHPAFGTALTELLHSPEPYRRRFRTWLRLLDRSGERVSWQLATALPALVHPTEHVCVRPAAFSALVRELNPGSKAPKDVTPPGYSLFLRTASALDKELRALPEPVAARDLIDLHDFVHIALRAKSVKAYRARRSS